eukprot:scaffold1367_cov56-Cyclotella_meneghiniana.AAC.4
MKIEERCTAISTLLVELNSPQLEDSWAIEEGCTAISTLLVELNSPQLEDSKAEAEFTSHTQQQQ